MATKYVSKDGWNFQYILSDVKPFYTALIGQGGTASATPIEQEDAPGVVKTIFPGGNITANQPQY